MHTGPSEISLHIAWCHVGGEVSVNPVSLTTTHIYRFFYCFVCACVEAVLSVLIFRKNYSVYWCRFGVSIGASEFTVFLHNHFWTLSNHIHLCILSVQHRAYHIVSSIKCPFKTQRYGPERADHMVGMFCG